MALKRLTEATYQLQEVTSVIQKDTISKIFDRQGFDDLKNSTKKKIEETRDLFLNDVKLVGVEKEFNILVEITKEFVEKLPFPEELAILAMLSKPEEMISKGIEFSFNSLSDLARGKKSVADLKRSVQSELSKVSSGLKTRYEAWWNDYSVKVQHACRALQKALSDSYFKYGWVSGSSPFQR